LVFYKKGLFEKALVFITEIKIKSLNDFRMKEGKSEIKCLQKCRFE